jgi:hypothetical protein
MLRLATVTALIASGLATVSTAQVTSYKSNNQSLIKGDPNAILCKREEAIGTRLGAKKVCLTIAEWNDLARENRERTEHIQAGVCVPGEGQACADPF